MLDVTPLRRLPGSLALVALVCLAGCDGDDPETDAGATDAGARTDAWVDPACERPGDAGSVSRPDAGPPATPPSVDCGTPTFPSGTTLRRYPYLQSVTPTSARIVWTSTAAGRGVVRWAESSDGPWTEVEAATETFETSRTDDSTDYVAFDAQLDGLEGGQRYCYEVVLDGVTLASGLAFDTAWTDAARPLRILAFGDSGTGSDEQLALRDQMLTEDFDLFLHLGDMAYDDGTFPEFEANVFGVYRDLMHRVPAFPTIGNHEYITDSGQPYVDVYYLFEQAYQPGQNERYYSFDYGNVHFVSLESNEGELLPILLDRNGRVDDDQLDWLVDDLAASDAPWKIAIFHHPPYSSGSHGDSAVVQQLFLPALEEGGVDLVLVGHDHHYERTLPLRAGCFADEVTGITFVVAGAGGASLRDTLGDRWWSAAVADQVHSYLSLTVHGCVAHGQAIDAEGNVLDDWTLDGCE